MEIIHTQQELKFMIQGKLNSSFTLNALSKKYSIPYSNLSRLVKYDSI